MALLVLVADGPLCTPLQCARYTRLREGSMGFLPVVHGAKPRGCEPTGRFAPQGTFLRCAIRLGTLVASRVIGKCSEAWRGGRLTWGTSPKPEILHRAKQRLSHF